MRTEKEEIGNGRIPDTRIALKKLTVTIDGA
jgi:hypothetical protein